MNKLKGLPRYCERCGEKIYTPTKYQRVCDKCYNRKWQRGFITHLIKWKEQNKKNLDKDDLEYISKTIHKIKKIEK